MADTKPEVHLGIVASLLRRHTSATPTGRHFVGKAARLRLAPPAMEASRLGIPTAESAILQREVDLRCGEDTVAREMVALLSSFVRDCNVHGETSREAAESLGALASLCLSALADIEAACGTLRAAPGDAP